MLLMDDRKAVVVVVFRTQSLHVSPHKVVVVEVVERIKAVGSSKWEEG